MGPVVGRAAVAQERALAGGVVVHDVQAERRLDPGAGPVGQRLAVVDHLSQFGREPEPAGLGLAGPASPARRRSRSGPSGRKALSRSTTSGSVCESQRTLTNRVPRPACTRRSRPRGRSLASGSRPPAAPGRMSRRTASPDAGLAGVAARHLEAEQQLEDPAVLDHQHRLPLAPRRVAGGVSAEEQPALVRGVVDEPLQLGPCTAGSVTARSKSAISSALFVGGRSASATVRGRNPAILLAIERRTGPSPCGQSLGAVAPARPRPSRESVACSWPTPGS